MGVIVIKVPQDVSLEFNVSDIQKGNGILTMLKSMIKPQTRNKNKASLDDLVGIWSERFDDTMSSEEIQRTWRRTTWNRS